MPAVLAALKTKDKKKKVSPSKEVQFKSRNKNIYLEDDGPTMTKKQKKAINQFDSDIRRKTKIRFTDFTKNTSEINKYGPTIL